MSSTCLYSGSTSSTGMSSSPVPRGLCFNLVDQMWNGINMYQLPISPIIMEVETGCNYYWGDPFFDFHDYWRKGIFWWKGIPQKIKKTPLNFNMEPENQPLEKEISFGNYHFQVPCQALGAQSFADDSSYIHIESYGPYGCHWHFFCIFSFLSL